MNTDIYLDSSTHDIVYSDGDIRLTRDTLEDAAQRIKIRLQIFKGEWILDNREGVPYYQEILTKTSKEAVDAIFKAKVLEDPLVENLLEFTSTYNPSSSEYSLNFSVSLTSGDTLTDTFSLEI
jgi:hypothetical protein